MNLFYRFTINNLFNSIINFYHCITKPMLCVMKSYRTLNIILISICLLIDFYVYMSYRYNKSHTILPYSSLADTQINMLAPIDTTTISPDLPYSKFKELKMQQQIARSYTNGENSTLSANFFDIVAVGTSEILCKTCTIKGPIEYIPNTSVYYHIALRGWKLKSTRSPVPKSDSVIFYVQKGQAYIRKNVVETDTTNGIKTRQLVVKDVPVKFKYSHKLQMLKIPVSKQTKNTVTYIIKYSMIALALYSFFISLIFVQLIINLLGGSSFAMNTWWKAWFALAVLPLFIIWMMLRLIKILWGNKPTWNADDYAFTDYNIFRLRVLAYSFTCIPLLFVLLTPIMRLIFSSYFTEDVVLNTTFLYPWWITMHVGILLILILQAFMQGKALKDEQDLTV